MMNLIEKIRNNENVNQNLNKKKQLETKIDAYL